MKINITKSTLKSKPNLPQINVTSVPIVILHYQLGTKFGRKWPHSQGVRALLIRRLRFTSQRLDHSRGTWLHRSRCSVAAWTPHSGASAPPCLCVHFSRPPSGASWQVHRRCCRHLITTGISYYGTVYRVIRYQLRTRLPLFGTYCHLPRSSFSSLQRPVIYTAHYRGVVSRWRCLFSRLSAVIQFLVTGSFFGLSRVELQ